MTKPFLLNKSSKNNMRKNQTKRLCGILIIQVQTYVTRKLLVKFKYRFILSVAFPEKTLPESIKQAIVFLSLTAISRRQCDRDRRSRSEVTLRDINKLVIYLCGGRPTKCGRIDTKRREKNTKRVSNTNQDSLIKYPVPDRICLDLWYLYFYCLNLF